MTFSRILLLPVLVGCVPALQAASNQAAYSGAVSAVLQAKCTGCHGEAKQKGKLRMDSLEALLKGGSEGPAVVPGKVAESLMLTRIDLPEDDDERMPPEGEEQLTKGEIQLLRKWVEKGASASAAVTELGLDEAVLKELAATPKAKAAPPAEKKAAVPVSLVDPAVRKKILEEVNASGASLMQVAQDNPLLRFSALNVAGRFGDEQLRQLAPVSADIVWMDLARAKVSNGGLAVVSGMKNLSRLHLENTAVSDDGLCHLAALSQLEYLNLYGTGTTDKGLEHLRGLKNLKKLYLWQSQVTSAGAEQLRKALPGLVVNLGWEHEAQPVIAAAPATPAAPAPAKPAPAPVAAPVPAKPAPAPAPVSAPVSAAATAGAPAATRAAVQEAYAAANLLLQQVRESVASGERRAKEGEAEWARLKALVEAQEKEVSKARGALADAEGAAGGLEAALVRVRGKGGLEKIEANLNADLASAKGLAEEAKKRLQALEPELKSAQAKAGQAAVQAAQETRATQEAKARIPQLEKVLASLKRSLEGAPQP